MAPFKVNDLVWAKMKGFPPWPGIISEPPDELKQHLIKAKSCFCIYFFGTKNYSWIETGNLKHYEENKEDLKKAAKSSGFLTAIKEIEQYILGDKSVIVTAADDPFDQLLGRNVPPKKAKQSDSGKKKLSLSADEPLKQTDESSSDESTGSSHSKRKPPKTHKKSMKNDEVPYNHSLPKKKPSTTATEEDKTKRHASGLDDKPAHEDTYSPIAQHFHERLSLPMLLPSISSYRPFHRGFSTSFSRPESPPKDIQKYSEGQKNSIIPSKLRFGFIGLGTLGSAIVKHLLKTGHKVSVWNHKTERSEMLQEMGAEVSDTISDLIQASDVTFCCVLDVKAASDIVYGHCGVLEDMSKGKSYVEMSRLDSDTSMSIAEAIISKGGRYLEVRLQGSLKEADEGSLVVLAAGERSLYNDCETCFAAFANHSIFLGESGNAANVNTIVQTMSGITVGALAEGLALAGKRGISHSVLMEILNRCHLNCNLLIESGQATCEKKMSSKRYLNHLQNDIKNAIKLADSTDQRLSLGGIAYEINKQYAGELGHSDEDSATGCLSIMS